MESPDTFLAAIESSGTFLVARIAGQCVLRYPGSVSTVIPSTPGAP